MHSLSGPTLVSQWDFPTIPVTSESTTDDYVANTGPRQVHTTTLVQCFVHDCVYVCVCVWCVCVCLFVSLCDTLVVPAFVDGSARANVCFCVNIGAGGHLCKRARRAGCPSASYGAGKRNFLLLLLFFFFWFFRLLKLFVHLCAYS